MSRSYRCRALCAALALTAVLALPLTVNAASAYLRGSVVFQGKPVPNVLVTVIGNNVARSTRTDAQGGFQFASLSQGTYTLEVTTDEGSGKLVVDLPASGTIVTLELGVKTIASVTTVARLPVAIRGSGTDLTLNASALSKTPASGNFPELLIQLPGAARGANGVVHLNGDHGDINYIVDGVVVPQELNRVVGTEFNPGDAAFVDVLQGAYPAQYGERFATILNISTRTGVAAPRPGASLEVDGGSFATFDGTLGYHDRIGPGALVLAVQNGSTGRGLDPPQPASLHNEASNANQFVRYTLPYGREANN